MKNEPSADLVEAWVALLGTSQRLLSALEDTLKKAGLPPLVWFDVLIELEHAGADGLRPFEIVDRMLLAQYNVSRLLTRMEADGLVERLDCPDDGRGQVVRITKAGRTTQRRIWRVYGPAITDLLGTKLTPAEQGRLAKLLAKV